MVAKLSSFPVQMISGSLKMVNVASYCAPHGPLVSPYLTSNASVVKPEEHVITSDIPCGIFAHLQLVDPGAA